MKRSDFLKLMIAAGALPLASQRLLKRLLKVVWPLTKRKIIVIGAGMAGIAAARTLKDAGHEVLVIEARPRIGGRIWTSKILGTPLDLGASWIHEPKGNPINKLAKKYNVKTLASDYDSLNLYQSDGALFQKKKQKRLLKKERCF